MVDVKQAATLTHAAGAMVVVDNTFLSPALLRPKVAEFLAGHPAIIETRYPGLPGDPGHSTAKSLLDSFGGMVGFIIAGGQAAADTFSVSLKLCKPWVSIGAVKTLIYPRRLNRVKVSRRVYAYVGRAGKHRRYYR